MRRNQRGRGNRKIKVFNKEHFDEKFIKSLSIAIISLFGILLCITIFFQIYNYFQHKQFVKSVDESIEQSLSDANAANEKKEEKKETDTTFTMTAIGDVMCHNTQYLDAYVETDDEENNYDFSYVFEDIYRYTKITDITIGSLETSFAGKERGYSNYQGFPEQLTF